jgi:hypothetical protein
MFMQVVKYACCQILLVIIFIIIGNGIVSMDIVFSGCEGEDCQFLLCICRSTSEKIAETCCTEYNRMKSCCFLKFCCSEHMACVVHVFVLVMLCQLHILRVISQVAGESGLA